MSKKEKLLKTLRSKPKAMRAQEIMKLLKWFGFKLEHINGDHHVYSRDFRMLCIPMKGDQGEVKNTYIKSILNDIEEIIAEEGVPWEN